MEHIRDNDIVAVFGSSRSNRIRQPSGHIGSPDSLEFRSLPVAACNVCHGIASRFEFLPKRVQGILQPNAGFAVEIPAVEFISTVEDPSSGNGMFQKLSRPAENDDRSFPRFDFFDPDDQLLFQTIAPV
jgi:hypothetical protein